MAPDSTLFQQHMDRGTELHAAQRPELALVAFEQALALYPHDINAASACASMHLALGQAGAAWRLLLPLRDALLASADGAANFAIAAEGCGELDQARAAYRRALELQPEHPRALNNLALLALREGDLEAAVRMLERCIEQTPSDSGVWLNLCDALAAAHRYSEAVVRLTEGIRRFPASDVLRVRQAVVLAFDGQLKVAQQALDALQGPARETLLAFLRQGQSGSARMVRGAPVPTPDARDLFCQQAFEAMHHCDWRDHDRVTAAIREALAHAERTGQGRDWRDTQFYGLMLPLHEDELARLRVWSIAAIGRQLAAPTAAFIATRSRRRDDRIHVGLAVQSLRDPRVGNALWRQLQLHDRARFAIHVYSPTPEPDFARSEQLAALCESVVEIAHMRDDEAVGRMRLDELDVFVDMAFDTPWCRPEIPECRVAPIQLRQMTWHRHHPPRPCEYSISDVFIHPPGTDMQRYGAVVRLPFTCWLHTNDDVPDAQAPSRAQMGLPTHGVVLTCLLPPLMVDPDSFGLWMSVLRDLPGSVLWLPAFGPGPRRNLGRAAHMAGIDPQRIVFMPRGSRAQMLARLARADLFIDTLRFGSGHGLIDALRMGVPALSCAGPSMASRIGGSILHAAGMQDGVVETREALLDKAVAWGRNPAALEAARARLRAQQQQGTQAPAALFDLRARVQDWENAWAMMAERHRQGLPPAAFDVPSREGGVRY